MVSTVFIPGPWADPVIEIHLGVSPTIVGRDSRCHVQPDVDTVSDHHAWIAPPPNGLGFLVCDTNSINGTFIWNNELWHRVEKSNNPPNLAHFARWGSYIRLGRQNGHTIRIMPPIPSEALVRSGEGEVGRAPSQRAPSQHSNGRNGRAQGAQRAGTAGTVGGHSGHSWRAQRAQLAGTAGTFCGNCSGCCWI